MKLVLYAIGRLIVICFALFLALLAGSLFIGFGFSSGIIEGFLGEQTHAEVIDTDIGHLAIGIATFVIAVFTSIHLAPLAVLPVTLAVATSEMMRWQSMVVHLVLGGVCALFILFSAVQASDVESIGQGTVIVSLAAGFVAAFFYWLVAGRNAGEWLSALGEKDLDREG